jgi:Cu/Ag efflux pump CusA
MDMMSTSGVRTPVGIRIVAAHPSRLEALGGALQAWATGLAGTRSAAFESLGGEPWLGFDADPAALQAFGVVHVDLRIPVLYTIWRCHQLRLASEAGVPIQAILGRVPRWAR